MKKNDFELQLLRARLDIRDLFLTAAMRQVYDHIGQVFSLARWHASGAGSMEIKRTEEEMKAVSDLIAQGIQELRKMCSYFFPDTVLLANLDLREALLLVYQMVEPGLFLPIEERGKYMEISNKLIILYLYMIKSLLTSLKKLDCISNGILIHYKNDSVSIVLRFKRSKAIRKTAIYSWYKLSLKGELHGFDQQLNVLKGKLCMKGIDENRFLLQLSLPIQLDYA